MKTILLSVLIFLVSASMNQAQILYGTTFMGGTKGGGTINKLSTVTKDFEVVYSLENLTDFSPGNTSFVKARDGKLYGVSPIAGSTGFGVGNLFSFDPAASEYTNLF